MLGNPGGRRAWGALGSWGAQPGWGALGSWGAIAVVGSAGAGGAGAGSAGARSVRKCWRNTRVPGCASSCSCGSGKAGLQHWRPRATPSTAPKHSPRGGRNGPYTRLAAWRSSFDSGPRNHTGSDASADAPRARGPPRLRSRSDPDRSHNSLFRTPSSTRSAEVRARSAWRRQTPAQAEPSTGRAEHRQSCARRAALASTSI